MTVSAAYKAPLPFQEMPTQRSIEIYSFSDLRDNTMPSPHRHKFDMILWSTKGIGSHEIDFKEYEMAPGKLFLLRQGHVHLVRKYAEEGFIILIRTDTGMNLDQAVWSSFYSKPFIDLREFSCETFMGMFSFLQIEARSPKPDLAMTENLLNGMFLALKRQIEPGYSSDLSSDIDLHLRLNELLERYCCFKKNAEFYSAQLNITSRRLNEILKNVHGTSLHQLIQEKLLIESRSLLSTTRLSVKEIAFRLGFEDPAYFCRFFKRNMGFSPNSYRETTPSMQIK